MLHFDLNKFNARAILFGALTFILTLILGFSLSGEDITMGRFIIYSAFPMVILGAIFEPVLAIIQKRRVNGPELIGGAWLGTLLVSFICAGICLLFGIIK